MHRIERKAENRLMGTTNLVIGLGCFLMCVSGMLAPRMALADLPPLNQPAQNYFVEGILSGVYDNMHMGPVPRVPQRWLDDERGIALCLQPSHLPGGTGQPPGRKGRC